jgi:hypothetical protein
MVIMLRGMRYAGHEARMEEREYHGEIGVNGMILLGQIFK